MFQVQQYNPEHSLGAVLALQLLPLCSWCWKNVWDYQNFFFFLAAEKSRQQEKKSPTSSSTARTLPLKTEKSANLCNFLGFTCHAKYDLYVFCLWFIEITLKPKKKYLEELNPNLYIDEDCMLIQVDVGKANILDGLKYKMEG
jgi:hypothetical protein